MVSWRANGYAVCGDFPSGKIIAYPSHAVADFFGCFRVSSYSKASTSMIAASLARSILAGRLLESMMSNIEDSRSKTAKGGQGISGTVLGGVQVSLANTLHNCE